MAPLTPYTRSFILGYYNRVSVSTAIAVVTVLGLGCILVLAFYFCLRWLMLQPHPDDIQPPRQGAPSHHPETSPPMIPLRRIPRRRGIPRPPIPVCTTHSIITLPEERDITETEFPDIEPSILESGRTIEDSGNNEEEVI